jgi:glycosyltransferase involved in cell wall biosynthesis
VRALVSAGHEVVVIAPDAFSEAGFEVLSLKGGGAFGWPGALPRLRQNPLRSFGAARWIHDVRHALHEGGFDRIVAHWALPCAFPAAIDAPGELEIVSHGSDVALLERMPAPLRIRIVRSLAERASVWRFVSGALLSRLERVLPPNMLDRIAEVRPCAIDVPDVRELAEAKRRTMREPFVSTIGRLVSSKRMDLVVEAAGRERMPLVVVGDGPERRRLERTALRCRTDAHFVGRVPREDALAWMRASSALWFAGLFEGLPTVLREAEALGVPVRML